MEPVVIALCAVSLVSLFAIYVKCFDCIHFGRSFEREYGKCFSRLDAAKVKLSNLNEAVTQSQEVSRKEIPQADLNRARNLVQQLENALNAVEEVSRRYESLTMYH